MAPTDDADPVLIPSLPEPWEGLVMGALDAVQLAEMAEWTMDFPEIARTRHAASRAERALRLAITGALAALEAYGVAAAGS